MSKEPETSFLRILLQLYYSGLHYVGFILVAILGGLMRYLTRLTNGTIKQFNILSMLADVMISAFAGILVALIAMSYDLRPELIAALCGIAGHLGARGIFLVQYAVLKKLNLPNENIEKEK